MSNTKQLFLGTLTALLFTTSSLVGDCIQECSPHQVLFGYDFLQLNVDTHIKDVSVCGKKDLAGVQISYDYLKPWAFYTGVDGLAAWRSRGLEITEEGKELFSTDHRLFLANLALRFGYTLSTANLYFSPFLGTGFYALGNSPQGLLEGSFYLSGGLRSKFQLNPIFSIGVNLEADKAMPTFEHFNNDHLKVTTSSMPWGGEVSLPLVWSFHPARTWTFQAEPFYRWLPLSGKQELYGAKFLIGAHF